jgi:hypothetical protein
LVAEEPNTERGISWGQQENDRKQRQVGGKTTDVRNTRLAASGAGSTTAKISIPVPPISTTWKGGLQQEQCIQAGRQPFTPLCLLFLGQHNADTCKKSINKAGNSLGLPQVAWTEWKLYIDLAGTFDTQINTHDGSEPGNMEVWQVQFLS